MFCLLLCSSKSNSILSIHTHSHGVPVNARVLRHLLTRLVIRVLVFVVYGTVQYPIRNWVLDNEFRVLPVRPSSGYSTYILKTVTVGLAERSERSSAFSARGKGYRGYPPRSRVDAR